MPSPSLIASSKASAIRLRFQGDFRRRQKAKRIDKRRITPERNGAVRITGRIHQYTSSPDYLCNVHKPQNHLVRIAFASDISGHPARCRGKQVSDDR